MSFESTRTIERDGSERRGEERTAARVARTKWDVLGPGLQKDWQGEPTKARSERTRACLVLKTPAFRCRTPLSRRSLLRCNWSGRTASDRNAVAVQQSSARCFERVQGLRTLKVMSSRFFLFLPWCQALSTVMDDF